MALANRNGWSPYLQQVWLRVLAAEDSGQPETVCVAQSLTCAAVGNDQIPPRLRRREADHLSGCTRGVAATEGRRAFALYERPLKHLGEAAFLWKSGEFASFPSNPCPLPDYLLV